MIEACARLCQLLSLPRTTGQIYGLLYLSVQPMSLDDMVSLLTISKASASMGARQLVSLGAIRAVWVPGERRDYFEVIDDLSALLRGGYENFLKPRLESSRRRLSVMQEHLDEDRREGALTDEEFRVCADRLKALGRVQKRIQTAVPLAEKVLL